MEAKEALKSIDEIKVIQRRFEMITVARYRNKSRIKKAVKIQDKIREKTKGGISLTKRIRKWRDMRYAPSS